MTLSNHGSSGFSNHCSQWVFLTLGASCPKIHHQVHLWLHDCNPICLLPYLSSEILWLSIALESPSETPGYGSQWLNEKKANPTPHLSQRLCEERQKGYWVFIKLRLPVYIGPNNIHFDILYCILVYINRYAWVCGKLLQLHPTLFDPMDCSPPGCSVHGILQARILEWVSIPSCKRFSWPRDQTWAS